MTKLYDDHNKIEKSAQEWLRLILSDEVTDEDIEAFENWRDEKPQHQIAYAEASQTWNELGVLERSPQGESLRQSVALNLNRDNILSTFLKKARNGYGYPAYAVASIFVILGFLFITQTTHVQPPEIFQTTTSEVKEINLADGSIITLGALSRVEVLYLDDRRNVLLKQGQAFFDVAKDPNKPFYVKVQNNIVQVLGTKFDVHLGPTEVTIGVLEGKVQVAPNDPSKEVAETRFLSAGQTISAVATGHLRNVKQTKVVPGTWRTGRLAYQEAPFAQILADANRYYSGHIVLEDESLSNIQVTTSFDVTQIEEFLETLPALFEVEIVYLSSGNVIIKPLSKNRNVRNYVPRTL